MQCGRLIIPEVAEPVSLMECSRMAQEELLLVPYEEAKSPGLRETLRTEFDARPGLTRAGIVIGPEGGMEPEEAKALAVRGKLLSLGPRILRTETAGMCVLSAVMYEAGEMEWR
jgi:16S rRNA (uracil1498-N3)-methyltransferase